MITIEKAKSLIKQNSFLLEETKLSTPKPLGFVLSKDIFSPIDLPSFDQSAMDGYAICFSEQHHSFLKV